MCKFIGSSRTGMLSRSSTCTHYMWRVLDPEASACEQACLQAGGRGGIIDASDGVPPRSRFQQLTRKGRISCTMAPTPMTKRAM